MAIQIEELYGLRVEDKLNKMNKKGEHPPCIFKKGELCKPYEVQFSICLKCHKCKAFTLERAIPDMFDRIVAIAGLIMATFGISMGGTGGAGGGAAGGGGGGGGGR